VAVFLGAFGMTARALLRRLARLTPSAVATAAWLAALVAGFTVRLRDEFPADDVAMAFPDFPRYRTLLSETGKSLIALRIGIFFVSETGLISRWPATPV
jgi:hypothetical protein